MAGTDDPNLDGSQAKPSRTPGPDPSTPSPERTAQHTGGPAAEQPTFLPPIPPGSTPTPTGGPAADVPADPAPPPSEPSTPTPSPPTPSTPTPSTPTPSTPGPPSWLERIPAWTIPALLVGLPLLIALASAVWPTQVYDQFVWKYFWGPIKADADGFGCQTVNGVMACPGYNLANTAAWAVLLGLCIVGAGQMLQRFRAPMDGRLIVAATLWVVAGSIFHVLEDGKLFAAPLRYFFITPIIYLLFAAFGIASFLLGQYLRSVAERTSVAVALQKMWMILAIPILGYLFLYLESWHQVRHYLNPILVTLFALAAFAVASWRFQRLGRIVPSELVAYLSIGWILTGLAYVAGFAMKTWPFYLSEKGMPNPLPSALWAPVLALAVVLVVRLIAKSMQAKHPVGAAAFLNPINGLIIFAQMADAFATAIGIDIGRYSEKHVFSGKVIDLTAQLGERLGIDALVQYKTFFGFVTVKLLVSLLVIYAIDISNPKDSKRYPTFIGLVKFAIIMVGIGPAIRNFLRMALGI